MTTKGPSGLSETEVDFTKVHKGMVEITNIVDRQKKERKNGKRTKKTPSSKFLEYITKCSNDEAKFIPIMKAYTAYFKVIAEKHGKAIFDTDAEIFDDEWISEGVKFRVSKEIYLNVFEEYPKFSDIDKDRVLANFYLIFANIGLSSELQEIAQESYKEIIDDVEKSAKISSGTSGLGNLMNTVFTSIKSNIDPNKPTEQQMTGELIGKVTGQVFSDKAALDTVKGFGQQIMDGGLMDVMKDVDSAVKGAGADSKKSAELSALSAPITKRMGPRGESKKNE